MRFCCTDDVVSQSLFSVSQVKFPQERDLLLKLMSEDQADRQVLGSKDLTNPKYAGLVHDLTAKDQARTKQAQKILLKIKSPSVKNIGLDGSRALWLIALHSPSSDLKKEVLKKMRRIYYRDHIQVFYPGIPYLADRVSIESSKDLASATQSFGSQGYIDEMGDLKLFRIRNTVGLKQRRKKYGLYFGPDYQDKACLHEKSRK